VMYSKNMVFVLSILSMVSYIILSYIIYQQNLLIWFACIAASALFAIISLIGAKKLEYEQQNSFLIIAARTIDAIFLITILINAVLLMSALVMFS
jgi:hypothetical protein